MSDFDIGLPPYITYLRKILNKYTDGQILKVNFIIKISFCLYFKQKIFDVYLGNYSKRRR